MEGEWKFGRETCTLLKKGKNWWIFFRFRIQEKSEEAEHISVEMAEVVESLDKLRDEIIKTDLAYRKIENVAKEKKIESDLVRQILLSYISTFSRLIISSFRHCCQTFSFIQPL